MNYNIIERKSVIMCEAYKKLSDYIDSKENEIVASLIRLVKINSILDSPKDKMPYGEGVYKALEEVKSLYEENGYPMQVKHENGYAIYKTENGKNTRIGLFSHADVVPVKNDWIYAKPFEPKLVGTKLFGRGVEDDKSGIVASLYALKALRETGYEPGSDITVFVGGNEESGMEDITNFCENETMPTVSLVPDYDFPYSEGEKGILHIDCMSNAPFVEITCFEGGAAYNVVLDEVNIKIKYNEKLFEELKAKNAEVTKKDNEICLTVRGITRHVAMPEGSVNAAYKASELLCTAESLCENDKKILSCIKNTLGGYYGEGFNIEHEDMFGKLDAANGIVKLVDSKLFFTLDIRYGVKADAADIIKNVKSTLEKYNFNGEICFESPGFLLDSNKALSAALLNAYRSVTGKEGKPFKSSGGTYARHLKNAFSTGTTTCTDKSEFNFPQGHGNIHQSDECIDIKGFIEGIKVLAAMIYEADTILKEDKNA